MDFGTKPNVCCALLCTCLCTRTQFVHITSRDGTHTQTHSNYNGIIRYQRPFRESFGVSDSCRRRYTTAVRCWGDVSEPSHMLNLRRFGVQFRIRINGVGRQPISFCVFSWPMFLCRRLRNYCAYQPLTQSADAQRTQYVLRLFAIVDQSQISKSIRFTRIDGFESQRLMSVLTSETEMEKRIIHTSLVALPFVCSAHIFSALHVSVV